MADKFYTGKRLSFDGQLCTVRYQGQVQGTNGEWLGIEWDDPTRGKHSGENGGVKYFECLSRSPTVGSFVRPTRKSDPPRSYVEALKVKYASEDFEDPDVQVVFQIEDKTKKKKKKKKEWVIPGTEYRPIRISGKEVEEVGFDKIRKQLANLNELRIVILDGLCMSRPNARWREIHTENGMDAWPVGLTDVKDASPKVVELDLSRNLFEEWREVASICEQLGSLKSLRADGNRFRDTSLTPTERERCFRAFEHITSLKLENTLLSWEDITNITTLFPRLTSFIASTNTYTILTNHFLTHTITDLSLEENEFQALSDLTPLTQLLTLERLILKYNNISEITRPGVCLPVFSKTVTEVDISYNEVASWPLIDKLETIFPGLTSLRVSHNPIYSSLHAADGRALSAEDGYMLTLARLGNLRSLNHSPITDKERLNAESYYLSLIARELNFSPPSLEAQILASHPRYAYLCSEYGEPVINRSTNAVNPNSLAARLIRFTFYLSEGAKRTLTAEPEKKQEKRFEAEIPKSCTAYTLHGIVGRRFDIPPKKCRLIWETGDWMPAPRTFDDAVEEGDRDSESSDDDDDRDDSSSKKDEGRTTQSKIMREEEIVPGSRAAGNWVEGMKATVRVEVR